MKSPVSIIRCPDYNYDQVEAAVQAALEPLGGMREFVKPGQSVLLKVNMLAAKAPDRGITTHPRVLEAVARQVIAAGGRVIVGDSPAGVLRGIKRFWENTGIGAATETFGGELVQFEGTGTRKIEAGGREVHLASIVDQVDLVINLPKLKTHGLTLYTGAVKNCFGLLPGFQKANMHKAAPQVEPFSNILVDIFEYVRPRLNIMDAVLGLEGNGPSTSGSPRRVGLLLASPDAVALDAAAAGLIGYSDGMIDTTRIAGARGLGAGSLEQVDWLGPPLGEIAVGDYKLPSNSLLRMVPGWLAKLAGRFVWVRPRALADNCQACGVCIDNCPAGCMVPDASGVPIIDYQACINCLSCDESCAHEAIIQQMSWLAKKLQ